MKRWKGRSVLSLTATVAMLAGCSNLHTTSPIPTTLADGFAAQPLAGNGYSVLHRFTGGTDGEFPFAGLGPVELNGTLYGTTLDGGSGAGTVYEATASGAESVLYNFKGCPSGDGASPAASLTNVGGTLYGTTQAGGACSSNAGTIFKILPSGKETVLYSFTGGSDGASPLASLTNVRGVLYGTTNFGGGASACSGGCGTVFKMTASGAVRVIYRFQGNSDGRRPYTGGLTVVRGMLFGTTSSGGNMVRECPQGCGTVFSITTSGAEHVIYRFKGGTDGATPAAPLIDVGGTLYSTTSTGGNTGCFQNLGCGTVFAITPSGSERVLYAFKSGTDGAAPAGGLTNVRGTLYGTTYNGGGSGCFEIGGHGCGTIFRIAPSGSEQVIYRFKGGNDGANPGTSMTLAHGVLFGTTELGGDPACFSSGNGCGTLFKIAP